MTKASNNGVKSMKPPIIARDPLRINKKDIIFTPNGILSMPSHCVEFSNKFYH